MIHEIAKENLNKGDSLFASLTKNEKGNALLKYREKISTLKLKSFELIRPMAFYRTISVTEISPSIIKIGEGYQFVDIILPNYLKGISNFLVFLVTLGTGISNFSPSSYFEEYIYDTWNTAFCEASYLNFYSYMQHQFLKRKLFLTPEFSPGYSGFPLENQRIIFDLLKPERFGIYLTTHMLIEPIKSLSGIIGLSKKPIHLKGNSCSRCNIRDRCVYVGKRDCQGKPE